jgi:1-acylglycerone phosphate reductase
MLLPEARQLFDLNVFFVLAITQAFLPLFLKFKHPSSGVIANNPSVTPNPMAGIYNMSKTVTAILTDTLRLKLAPFGIKSLI